MMDKDRQGSYRAMDTGEGVMVVVASSGNVSGQIVRFWRGIERSVV